MIYQFEDYSLYVDRQELRRGTELVNVEPQVLDLLQYVIRHRERVVSKDDLIEHVRQAIGDSGDQQRLIRTIARKGIRFVGEVRGDQSSPTAGSGTDTMPSNLAAAAPRLPDKPSIAVLPFDNLSAEPDQGYLADGIVEAITAALSRIRSFFVIARNSAFTYRGRATNVRDIGSQLGVAYLLEGSVQKAGSRLRITVQLVETEGGAHVWTARHDGTHR